MSERYDAIVIGLGGMGSASAFHLTRRGKRVLGLEQHDLLHEQGSSHGLTRIIRLAYHEHPSYVPLLRRAYDLWHELEEVAGEPLLVTTGCLEGGPEDGPVFQGALEAAQVHGLEHEVLDVSEIGRRHPAWSGLDGDVRFVWQPDGGFLLAERSILGHVNGALAAGADLRFREPVIGWEPAGEGVAVTTSRGRYEADRLVICGGPWIGSLVPQLASLAVPERQVLGWFQPTRPELFTPDRFPVFLLEGPLGSFYGFPVHDAPGVKLGWYHHFGEPIDPSDPDRTARRDDEAALRAFLDRHLPDATGPTVMLKACIFTNTPDEHFVIDRLPDAPQVTVVSACSGHGFKFCSVIGEIAADLALEGSTPHDIGLFRLDRFGTGD